LKLTTTQIKALKSQAKQYNQSDGRGLNLVVHPKCSKYWCLFYRIEGKQKNQMGQSSLAYLYFIFRKNLAMSVINNVFKRLQ